MCRMPCTTRSWRATRHTAWRTRPIPGRILGKSLSPGKLLKRTLNSRVAMARWLRRLPTVVSGVSQAVPVRARVQGKIPISCRVSRPFFSNRPGLASAGGAVCSFATGASGKVSVATARWATTGEPPKMRAAKLENRETNTQRATALDFLTDEDPPGSAVSSTNLVPPRWSF